VSPPSGAPAKPRLPFPDVDPREAPVDGMEPKRDPATLEHLLKADGIEVSATQPLKKALLAIAPTEPCRPDEVMVGHYSLEVLFDTTDDPDVDDSEFTPQAAKPYDDRMMLEHMQNIGAAIRGMNGGRGPDIVSFTEVENAGVLKRLNDEALSDLGYQTIGHVEGTDKRGIECAVLSRYPMIGDPVLHPVVAPDGHTQRGILEVTLDVEGIPLTVLVNHWLAGRANDNPAKKAKAESRRTAAAAVLQGIVDAKLAVDPKHEVVILGDFNETLNGPALGSVKAATADEARAKNKVFDTIDTLENVKEALGDDGSDVQLGTHYYTPTAHWSQFDHALVSHTLLDGHGLAWVPGSTQVHAPESLRDARGAPRRYFLPHLKDDPNPTLIDPKGAGDHFPIAMRLRIVGRQRSSTPAP